MPTQGLPDMAAKQHHSKRGSLVRFTESISKRLSARKSLVENKGVQVVCVGTMYKPPTRYVGGAAAPGPHPLPLLLSYSPLTPLARHAAAATAAGTAATRPESTLLRY